MSTTNNWDFVAGVTESLLADLPRFLFTSGILPSQYSATTSDGMTDYSLILNPRDTSLTISSDVDNSCVLTCPFKGMSSASGVPIGSVSGTVTFSIAANDLQITAAESDGDYTFTLTFLDDPFGTPTVDAAQGDEDDLTDVFTQYLDQVSDASPFDLGELAVDSSYDLLIPTLVSFITLPDTDDSDASQLMAQMMTQGTAAPSGDASLLIPQGSNLELAIGDYWFMTNAVVPGLASSLGVDTSDFDVSQDPAVVTLDNDVDVEGESGTTVTITKLQVEFSNGGLSLDIKIEAGYFAMEFSGTVTIAVVDNGDGTESFVIAFADPKFSLDWNDNNSTVNAIETTFNYYLEFLLGLGLGLILDAIYQWLAAIPGDIGDQVQDALDSDDLSTTLGPISTSVIDITDITLDGGIVVAAALTLPGPWQAASPMDTARTCHTASSRSDGTVLVAAGASAANTPVAGCQIYDPASGNWSDAGDVNQARFYHIAQALSDGTVMIAGGWSSAYLSSSEVWDPSSQSWTTVGSMNAARGNFYNPSIRLSDDTVLIAGGYDGSDYLASLESYDPGAQSWAELASMSIGRWVHAAADLSEQSLYLVAGGVNDSGYLASVELYDYSGGDQWTSAPDMSEARYSPTATVLSDGTVLVAGGYNNESGYLSSAEIYDPVSQTWTPTVGKMKTGRTYHRATLLADGTVLVSGGEGSSGYLTSAEIYDPSTGLWLSAGDMNVARGGQVAPLLSDDTVLAAGGYNDNDGNEYLASADLFDPTAPSQGGEQTEMTAELVTSRPRAPNTLGPMARA